MGLLDDAIREHLELKRRRGADPAEVARAEQDALGPVRREPEPAAPVAEEHPAEASAPAAHAPDESHVHDEPDAHDASPAPAETQPPTPVADEQTRIILPDEHEPHDDRAHENRVSEEPAHEGDEPVDPRQSDIVHQPTTEFRVEDHDDEPPPPPREEREPREEPRDQADARDERPRSPDEDVLEETPDFLQETPEHDRLWFEQRPPRDFDFDD